MSWRALWRTLKKGDVPQGLQVVFQKGPGGGSKGKKKQKKKLGKVGGWGGEKKIEKGGKQRMRKLPSQKKIAIARKKRGLKKGKKSTTNIICYCQPE